MSSDPPGPPKISGYSPEEVLISGDRRVLVCKVEGGNPAPWVVWYRNSKMVKDTSTKEGKFYVNRHEIAVTRKEDGAIYECKAHNDLVKPSLVVNVTLNVHCKYKDLIFHLFSR